MRRFVRRLTFVSDGPHFGGAERYIVAMAHTARRRGIEPHIYWMPAPAADADVFGAARAGDIRVTTAEPTRTRTTSGVIREFRLMLADRRPDGLVINGSGRRRYWLLCWLTRRAGVPAVWVHQMVDGCDHRRLPPRWLGARVEGLNWWRVPQALRHRLAATAADAVVTLNAGDRERVARWQGVSREKIRVIPHGVDCEYFRFDPAGRERMHRAWGISGTEAVRPFIVGTAGRLSAEKRVELLIEATALLRERGIPAVAAVAGRGAEQERLLQLVRERGATGAVRFDDFAGDMPAFYSGLDVFVLCSRTESFGLALAEAMACERPVVATPTAGAMRQISHRHNGWQLSGWSPAELADALASMAADPAGRRRMGRNGRQSVIRQFSIDLTLERTLRALRGAPDRSSPLRWPGMNEAPFVSMGAEDLA